MKLTVEIEIEPEDEYCGGCRMMRVNHAAYYCVAFDGLPEEDGEKGECCRLPECKEQNE